MRAYTPTIARHDPMFPRNFGPFNEVQEVKSLADKASDDEISRLEKKLSRIKNARMNKNASSTDSDQSVVKMQRSASDEEARQFAAQLPCPQGVVDMAVSGVSGSL
eukprot:100128-Amphidinium_carterae.1